jgi:SAM-dependent methyltransferase
VVNSNYLSKDAIMDVNRIYWDAITEEYQKSTRISIDDFHYGPLIPGEQSLGVLPAKMKGLKCLEIGCGAAQNSIVLAKMGAECTAFDISEQQIKYAKAFAENAGVDIDLRCLSMDDPTGITGQFDFIHSVYAISFSSSPATVVKFAADHLVDDGVFLLSTGHPLAQCEWLQVDDEHGAFLPDYFNIPPDVRYDEDDNEEISSKNYPLSVISGWIADAGMCVERLLEPVANPGEVADVPYYSEGWAEYSDIFARIPSTAIFICRKLLF